MLTDLASPSGTSNLARSFTRSLTAMACTRPSRQRGAISFRYDYRINGRRETLTIGRYGCGGISLAAAREKLLAARRLLQDGISPALQKQREKARGPETKTFNDHATQWLYGATMAESTRSMRKSVLDCDILPICSASAF